MQEQIAERVSQYQNERNGLIAEANERMQKHQIAVAEHNARIGEIQTRVSQIEGAIQALKELSEGARPNPVVTA